MPGRIYDFTSNRMPYSISEEIERANGMRSEPLGFYQSKPKKAKKIVSNLGVRKHKKGLSGKGIKTLQNPENENFKLYKEKKITLNEYYKRMGLVRFLS
jgi:hypothetical protein